MTNDQSSDPKRIIAKLRATAPDPNSTMFGMPNKSAMSAAHSEAELEEHSSPRPLQGPGVYQLKRKAHDTPSEATSTLSPEQQDELWADLELDLDLELESAPPAPTRTRQTHALLDVLIDHDIHEQHTALGELKVPRELLERSAAQLQEDALSEPTFIEEQLTEAELFGGEFPLPRQRDLKSSTSRLKPEYNTHAPSCTHSTNPGLEERTTPAHKRYFLVCEEDGQERRVLLDTKLVELVAQLIFEPAPAR